VQKAECIIRGIYKKQKEAFTSVAFEKGLSTDKEEKWMHYKLWS
jgi:hypothetical protein